MALPAAVVDQGVSAGDIAAVAVVHDQGSFQVEGHQEDLACGAAGAEGDVRGHTLEDNRPDQDQAAWTLEEVLVQVRILSEGGTLVGDDRPARVLALPEHEEGVDRGADAAVMGQGVADLGEVWRLDQGRGAQQALDHQGQARRWAWDRVHRLTWDRAHRLAWDQVHRLA